MKWCLALLVGLARANDECDALKDLHMATNGPRWVKQSGWNGPSNADCCNASWFGVSCTNGSVTKISLPNNKLENSSLWNEFNWSRLPHLRILDLPHNQLNGSIPQSLLNSSIVDLDLSFSTIGALPVYWSPTFRKINLMNSHLRGPLKIVAHGLIELLVSFNQLEGEIPTDLDEAIPNLEMVDLSNNGLNGSIMPLTLLRNLSCLAIVKNHFSGPVPSEWRKLEVLDAYCNNFTGFDVRMLQKKELRTLSLGAGNFTLDVEWEACSLPPDTSLAQLSLTDTPLNADLEDVLKCVHKSHVLVDLVLSNTNLSGTLTDISLIPHNLALLDVSCNNLTLFNPDVSALTLLKTLNLSDNSQLQSTMPLDAIGDIEVLDISRTLISVCFSKRFFGTEYLNTFVATSATVDPDCTEPVDYPTFRSHGVMAAGSFEFDEDTQLLCPNWLLKNQGMLRLSSELLQRALCYCSDSFRYWDGTTCQPCPKGVICDRRAHEPDPNTLQFLEPSHTLQGNVFPLFANGSSPERTRDLVHADAVVPCYHHGICNFPTVPYTFTYNCSEGYHGRLCSQCKKGYYLAGELCLKCNFPLNVLSWILVASISMVLFYLGMRKTMNNVSGCAAGGIFLIFFQIMATVEQRVNRHGFTTISSPLSFHPDALQLECWDQNWDYVGSMLVLACAVFPLAILMLIASIKNCQTSARPETSCAEMIFIISGHFLNVLYLPLWNELLELLSCVSETEGVQHYPFPLSHPFAECWSHDSSEDPTRLAVGVVLIISTVLSTCQFFFAVCLCDRNPIRQKRLRFLSRDMRDETYYWPLFVVSRRILIALSIQFLPEDWMMALAVSAILSGSWLLHSLVAPYKRSTDNFFEKMCLAVALTLSIGFVVLDQQDVWTNSIGEGSIVFLVTYYLVLSVVITTTIVLMGWTHKNRLPGCVWDAAEWLELKSSLVEAVAKRLRDDDDYGKPKQPEREERRKSRPEGMTLHRRTRSASYLTPHTSSDAPSVRDELQKMNQAKTPLLGEYSEEA